MKLFGGALLTGGKSRHMGFDKCLLEFNGVPLWKRQLDLLRTVASEVVVVDPTQLMWLPAEMEVSKSDHAPFRNLNRPTE